MTQERVLGYVPNADSPWETNRFRDSAIAWDEFDRPPITAYSDFKAYLKKHENEIQELSRKFCYWPHVIADKMRIPMWNPHQHNLPICTAAGTKSAIASKMLIQKAKNAELKYEEINPYHTYIFSKAGVVRGGQSLSGIANAFNDYGAFSNSDVGEYNPDMNPMDAYDISEDVREKAKKRQVGWSEIETSDPVEELIFLSKNHVPVIIGSYALIGSSKVDSNGVRDGVIDGRGAHCTAALGAYRRKNGVDYILYAQSWGDTFSGGDDALLPGFMTWLSRKTLEKFVKKSTSFLDLFAVTYVEGLTENQSFDIPIIDYPDGMTYEK